MNRKTQIRIVRRRRLSARDHRDGRSSTPYFWVLFERVSLALTLLSVGVGVTAFVIDLSDRKQSRLVNAESLIAFREQAEVNAATLREIERNQDTRIEEAIARAWSTITTPAPGNSGKGAALAYLNGLNIPLNGINLSCEAMRGGWDDEKLECETPTFLEGAILRFAKLERAKLDGISFNCLHSSIGNGCSDLTGIILWEASLRGSQLYGASFQKAALWGANFEGSYASTADFTGADAAHANFSGSDLSFAVFNNTNIDNTLFIGANISGADFTNSNRTSEARFGEITGSRAWAWRHTPPSGLDARLYDTCDAPEAPLGSEILVLVAPSKNRPEAPSGNETLVLVASGRNRPEGC